MDEMRREHFYVCLDCLYSNTPKVNYFHQLERQLSPVRVRVNPEHGFGVQLCFVQYTMRAASGDGIAFM
jgi:hypothetical protein